jgi:hypothetical protein
MLTSTPIALPLVISTSVSPNSPNEIATTTNFPGYSKESIRSKCNQHKVKGTVVNYKTAEKYTGKDEFDLLVFYPRGFARELHFDISVR